MLLETIYPTFNYAWTHFEGTNFTKKGLNKDFIALDNAENITLRKLEGGDSYTYVDSEEYSRE
jgi:hypothetical protein